MREIDTGDVTLRLGQLKGRWVVKWDHPATGKRRRFRLSADNDRDAEREAIDCYRRERSKRVGGLTVGEIWDAYREEKQGRRVADAMRLEAKQIGARFFHLRPDQITTALCREHTATRRAAGIKDGTIWTELGHLRTALLWAADARMIAHAPKIERPPKPAPRDRWLTQAEIARLVNAECAPHIKLACLLMLGTAGRPTAVLELTWDRVDLDRSVVDLRLDPSGPRKGRAVVPVDPALCEMLRDARAGALSDHVVEWCGNPVKSIKTGFAALIKAANLKGVTPHTLRHTAAVHMAAGGVPMERIAQFLGHSSTAITERSMPGSHRIICGLRPISSTSLRFTEPRRKPQKPAKPLKSLVGPEGLVRTMTRNGFSQSWGIFRPIENKGKNRTLPQRKWGL